MSPIRAPPAQGLTVDSPQGEAWCCALKKKGGGKGQGVPSSQPGTHRRPRRSTGTRTVSTEASEWGWPPLHPAPRSGCPWEGLPACSFADAAWEPRRGSADVRCMQARRMRLRSAEALLRLPGPPAGLLPPPAPHLLPRPLGFTVR